MRWKLRSVYILSLYLICIVQSLMGQVENCLIFAVLHLNLQRYDCSYSNGFLHWLWWQFGVCLPSVKILCATFNPIYACAKIRLNCWKFHIQSWKGVLRWQRGNARQPQYVRVRNSETDYNFFIGIPIQINVFRDSYWHCNQGKSKYIYKLFKLSSYQIKKCTQWL